MANSASSSSAKSFPIAKDPDAILTGTTLSIYKLLIKNGRPISAREVQRLLKLSSPSIAQFHLDKLERNGLVQRSSLNDGTYLVDRIFLKHFVRLKRFLVPKFLFYAILSTSFAAGWAGTLLIFFLFPASGNPQLNITPEAFFFSLIYGVSTTLILSGTYWYETLKAMRNEKI